MISGSCHVYVYFLGVWCGLLLFSMCMYVCWTLLNCTLDEYAQHPIYHCNPTSSLPDSTHSPSPSLILLLTITASLWPPQQRKNTHTNTHHHHPTRNIRNLPPHPPKQRTKYHRPHRSPNLSPTPQPAQHNPPLPFFRLQTPQTIQPRHDRRRRHGQQRSRRIQPTQGGDARKEEE